MKNHMTTVAKYGIKKRLCLECNKPLSKLDNPRRLYHGDRDTKGTCTYNARRRQERERNSMNTERKERRKIYLRKYWETYKDKRPKEYFREWHRNKLLSKQ